MIDEVDEVKMEVTVRTLNSAKLKWKLSRMILFRVHEQHRNLSEILPGIFLARDRGQQIPIRNAEYHYFTAASPSIVAIRFRHFFATPFPRSLVTSYTRERWLHTQPNPSQRHLFPIRRESILR